MTKPLIAAVICLLIASSAFLAYRWRDAESRLAKNVAWTHAFMDSLGSTLEFPNPPYASGVRDSLYWRWVATGAQLKLRMAQEIICDRNTSRQTLLDEADMAMLKQNGLTDPDKQLRESLQAHPDLIPYEGVLGGTMAFRQIVLLSWLYAFAEFDDGHIVGYALFSYRVENGKIEWKRLWAELI